MRDAVATFSLLTTLAVVTSAPAGEGADIDTSPRVFASAGGKYWVRVTTERGWTDVNTWDTTMTLHHADGGKTGYADEQVAAVIESDVFPARILVSDKGALTVLGHYGAVSFETVVTVYGPDGERRGTTDFTEFLKDLPGGGSGSPRALAFETLRKGEGATYRYYSEDFLVFPLAEGREARLNLESGRPAE